MQTSLPFSSCFLDFRVACSYGLESDKLLHKCSRKACKKACPQSLSPGSFPANWICIQPSSSGTARAQWPNRERSLERSQYVGNTRTSSRSTLGKLALISTLPAQRGPDNLLRGRWIPTEMSPAKARACWVLCSVHYLSRYAWLWGSWCPWLKFKTPNDFFPLSLTP